MSLVGLLIIRVPQFGHTKDYIDDIGVLRLKR